MPGEDLQSLFEHWLVEYQGIVLKVARAYTLNTDDYQDLAQEILLQLWQSLPQFQGRASACTWVYRVALNTALGWKRKERRRRSRHQPLLEVVDLPEMGADVPEQVVQGETVRRLYAAIRRLSKSDMAMILLYLDDLSYRQMAEILGISESNVGVKLNRAKKALAALMHEESHES